MSPRRATRAAQKGVDLVMGIRWGAFLIGAFIGGLVAWKRTAGG